MRRPCGMDQRHSLGPARRRQKTEGEGVTGTTRRKRGQGVKIKEEEEVRRGGQSVPHAQGPRGCGKVSWWTLFQQGGGRHHRVPAR